MCMILSVLLGKVCLAWPPCPSYSYNFSILCLAEYSKDQLNEHMIFCFFSCYCCCWAVPLHCSKFWVLVRWPGSHGETRAGGKRSILHQHLLLLRSYTSYPSCSSCCSCYASLHCCYLSCCHSPFFVDPSQYQVRSCCFVSSYHRCEPRSETRATKI